ncbi:type II toxin-antitoxin system death-on-curing family toxin [Pelagerythrobacter aerophilus]
MRNEPDWLTAEHLEQLNYRIVTEQDVPEPFGVLKAHELKSAPERPIQLWHYDEVDDLSILAVRLMMSVAWAHPFVQGNKRTGFAAAEIFLDANGWVLGIGDWPAVADEVIACVEDRSREYLLVELFRDHMYEMV